MNLNDARIILGVTKNASQEEIKQAYRDRTQIFHPDRFSTDSPRDKQNKENAEKMMRDLNEAYVILKEQQQHSYSYTDAEKTQREQQQREQRQKEHARQQQREKQQSEQQQQTRQQKSGSDRQQKRKVSSTFFALFIGFAIVISAIYFTIVIIKMDGEATNAEQKYMQMIQREKQAQQQIIQSINKPDDAAFLELCKTGTLQEIENAIKAGANINAKGEVENDEYDYKNTYTALMLAVEYNKNADVIRTLINAGANVNEVGSNYETALTRAAASGNTEGIAILLNAGAYVNARTAIDPMVGQVTALHYAAASLRNIDGVTLLLNAGADVNARTHGGGFTVLMWAASNTSYPEVISVLVNAGADVNAKHYSGFTALHCAAEEHNTEGIIILLNAGADVNAKDSNGMTALMTSAVGYIFYHEPNSKDIAETITTLLNAGADAKIRDIHGKRAVDYAEENEFLVGTEAYRRLQTASSY